MIFTFSYSNKNNLIIVLFFAFVVTVRYVLADLKMLVCVLLKMHLYG